jgi:hypothetical protein
MSCYAILERDLDESRDFFKLRKVRKTTEGIEEVSRERLDSLYVDFFTSKKNGKRYANLVGVQPITEQDTWYQVSN